MVSKDTFYERYGNEVPQPEVKMPKVKVGDTVTLNDWGIEIVFGSVIGLAHMKTMQMQVTEVGEDSLTWPEQTYPVEVDNPEINQFLIDDCCFDVVPS